MEFNDASANIKLMVAMHDYLFKQTGKNRVEDPDVMLGDAGKKWRRSTDDFIKLQRLGSLRNLMWTKYKELKIYNN